MLRFKERFESGTDLFSWSCRIAQNQFYEQHRKDKASPILDDPEGDLSAKVANGDNPERRMDLWDAVRRLDRLKAKERNSLLMFARGDNYAAIQKKNKFACEITARTSVTKAKAKLAGELEKPVVPGLVKAECLQCGTVVFHWRARPSKFCSRACVSKSQRRTARCSCVKCGAEFEAKPSDVARGLIKRCSDCRKSSRAMDDDKISVLIDNGIRTYKADVSQDALEECQSLPTALAQAKYWSRILKENVTVGCGLTWSVKRD